MPIIERKWFIGFLKTGNFKDFPFAGIVIGYLKTGKFKELRQPAELVRGTD
jgi:hypothetical protein